MKHKVTVTISVPAPITNSISQFFLEIKNNDIIKAVVPITIGAMIVDIMNHFNLIKCGVLSNFPETILSSINP